MSGINADLIEQVEAAVSKRFGNGSPIGALRFKAIDSTGKKLIFEGGEYNLIIASPDRKWGDVDHLKYQIYPSTGEPDSRAVEAEGSQPFNDEQPDKHLSQLLDEVASQLTSLAR